MARSWWVAGEFKVLRANHWETPLNLNSGVFMLLLLKCSPCVPGSVRAEEGIHTPQPDSLVLAVRSLCRVWCFATPWTAARQVSLSVTVSQSLLRLTSIESVMPSNHLILCRPLLLSPSILANIRVFSNESGFHITWPKYWSFSFNISPSNEHSGLISFRMDWLDLLAVQETLKSLLQHHRSKASILQYSAFFIVQNLTSIHDYWENHSLD